ncbi:MAG: hypothetical protein WDW36_007342 [Sanguina aurantia]
MPKRESEESSTDTSSKKSKALSDTEPVTMEIDEDLHSRQLAVYGREVMKRMAASSVLLIGLNGLGVEIAKNVILAGVRSVTLHDTQAVTLYDLSAQFYLTEDDAGKNRAEACKARLQELNTAVAVSASAAELSEAFLKQFQVVVVSGSLSAAEVLRLDGLCHASSIGFIRARTHGVFASVFTDFGKGFKVVDVDGEDPHTGIDERLEFQDGELVVFSEVDGMTELNAKPVRIKSCKAHSFLLELDTSTYKPYTGKGIVTQVKEGKVLDFKPMAEAISSPGEFLLSDFAKMERSALLHVGYQALDAFEAETGSMPRPAHIADAERVLALARQINDANTDKADIDEGVLRKLAHNAGSEISPMCAMFGGFVGQEVVKAVSGKFHPLFQWFHFDSIESLPDGDLPAEEFEPVGSRYDAQIAVFGRTLQRKLASLNLFLVGAGALGCEFLKNLAMMGVAADAGLVTLTDDDTIEKSNLSRQFLFRNWNIGKDKSSVAAAAATKLNPAFKVRALQNRVSPETELVFNDGFWNGLDLVVNALDNVNARLYVDSRCVYFCKPLLESGTLGTKCNTQMVVPSLTENYGASRDPPEKQAPMCTVHSFPHNIDHCLTWARSEFEGMLEKPSSCHRPG